MVRVSSVLLAVGVLSMVVACVPGGSESRGAACTSQTFDLNSRSEPLGSTKALVQAFEDAVEQQVDFTTMAETAGRAGWSPEWDRVIYVGTLTTDESLKRKSATDLQLACFVGLPKSNSNSDQPGPHATLFLAGGKPVQAVWWNEPESSLDFGSREFILSDTPIRYNPESRTMRVE
ncbi:hypothetical protein [Nocardia noduli]|uniref:hypothetical protein n=1 Tax=Nocardia noduli TaxID=2815722 RepID=UPI001C22FBAB|nr:hypothetical protein [Nocardia noduli]